MIDSARLANVIFDLGKRIPQSTYSMICESIETDSLSLDPYVIGYKKKDIIEENLFFSLKDGSRILISESVLNTLSSLDMDRETLIGFMSESMENFQNVLREIING